jgi:hypothetical protein
MRIRFERRGGLSGTRLACDVACDALPPEQRSVAEQLVHDSGFFGLPARIEDDAAGADRFDYRIDVDNTLAQHSVFVSEAAVPDRLRPLITWLTWKARGGS